MDNVFFNNIGHFFKMVAVDSIWNAGYFMWTYFSPNLTDQQIVTNTNSLYDGSLMDRYIYYAIAYLSYNSVCTYFWFDDINILYYLGIILLVPPVMNKIFGSSFFKSIREKKEMMIKICVAKMLTVIIKFYSKIYLKKKIKNFKYTELIYLLSDYKEAIGYFYDIIKNFLIIMFLSYIKKYSTKYYYDVIKYVYNYKTGELLDSFSGNDDAKEYLISIIENKQWHRFKKTNTYNAILKVYELNISEIDILSVINDEINFMLVKIFSIWTISSLLDSVYFVPILSSLLILYNKYCKQGRLRDMSVMVMVGLLCLVNDSYFLISFMSQCLPKLLFNNLAFKVYRKSRKYFESKINDLIVLCNNKIVIQHSVFVGYMAIIKIFKLQSMLVLLNMVFNIYMNPIGVNIIYGIIIGSSYLSNFNVWHIIFNTIMTFWIFNLEINIYEVKEYFIKEYNYQLEKKDIYKKIYKNIGGYILRRNNIDTTLFDELKLDTRNKSKTGIVIIDGFALNGKNIVEIDCKKKYDIIDDYMLSDDADSDISLKDSSLCDSDIDVILSDIKENTNKMQRIKSTGPVEVIDNYFNENNHFQKRHSYH